MEKRYESDMTRKEKRQNELKKLKSMPFKQKAAYIWEYYKGVFAGIIIACVIISIGVQMFQNSQLKSLLSIADRKSTRLNSSHRSLSRMPSSA